MPDTRVEAIHGDQDQLVMTFTRDEVRVLRMALAHSVDTKQIDWDAGLDLISRLQVAHLEFLRREEAQEVGRWSRSAA